MSTVLPCSLFQFLHPVATRIPTLPFPRDGLCQGIISHIFFFSKLIWVHALSHQPKANRTKSPKENQWVWVWKLADGLKLTVFPVTTYDYREEWCYDSMLEFFVKIFVFVTLFGLNMALHHLLFLYDFPPFNLIRNTIALCFRHWKKKQAIKPYNDYEILLHAQQNTCEWYVCTSSDVCVCLYVCMPTTCVVGCVECGSQGWDYGPMCQAL